MFQGKAKIERVGSNMVRLDTELAGISHKFEGPDAEAQAETHLDFVGSFYPAEDLVSGEAMEHARSLRAEWANPETRASANEKIDALKERAKTSEHAADMLYALRRMVKREHKVKLAGDIVEIGSIFSKIRKIAKSPLINPIETARALAQGAKVLAKSPLVNPIATARFLASSPLTNPIKLAQVVAKNPEALINPLATMKLARDAFVDQTKDGLSKVNDLMAIASGAIPKDASTGQPVAPSEAIEAQRNAQDAMVNLQAAAQKLAKDNQLPDEIADVHDEEPEAPDADDYPEDGTEDSEMSGCDSIGYDEEEDVSVAGGLGSLIKKFAPKLDPTSKGSWGASLVAAIPGIGPGVAQAAALVGDANKGLIDAQRKLGDVKSLAQAGVPTAIAAQKNIEIASKLEDERRKAAGEGRNIGGFRIPFPFRNLRRLGSLSGIPPKPVH